jgi:hypothetical protein
MEQIQVGSLAGAAQLLKDNAGVQRQAQKGQKPFVADKANSFAWQIFSVQILAVKACPSDPLVKSKTSVLYSFKVWS